MINTSSSSTSAILEINTQYHAGKQFWLTIHLGMLFSLKTVSSASPEKMILRFFSVLSAYPLRFTVFFRTQRLNAATHVPLLHATARYWVKGLD